MLAYKSHQVAEQKAHRVRQDERELNKKVKIKILVHIVELYFICYALKFYWSVLLVKPSVIRREN